MAGKSAILSIKILVDAAKAQAGFEKASGGLQRFQSGLGKAALPAAAVGAAVIGLAKTAVDSASRMQQAVGGVDAVFKSSAGQVHEWAAGAAESAGLSAAAYSELATVIGAQLKNAGVPMEELGGQTDALIRQGADLAAMFGGTTADAVSALSSALKGETDPIEKYGIGIKQADIAARMAADGTDKLKGAAGKAAKTQALLAMVTEQSADANGAFAREADSAATAQQKADAQFENAKASLGTILLPLVSKTADALGKMAKFASENATAVQVMLGVLGGLAAVILTLNAVMSVHTTVTTIWSAAMKEGSRSAKMLAAAQRLLSAAFVSSPIGWIVLAVVALVAAFIYAYKHSARFRAIVQGAMAAVKAAASAMAAGVMTAVHFMGRVFAAIGQVFAAVGAGLMAGVRAVGKVFAAVANFLAPVFRIAFRIISVAAKLAFAIIRLYLRIMQLAVKAVAWVIIKLFQLAWRAVSAAARAGMKVVRTVVAAVSGPIRAVASAIRSAFVSSLNAIRSLARTVAGAVKSAFTTLTAPLKAVMTSVLSWWRGKLDGLRQKATDIKDRIVAAFQRIADKVRGLNIPNPFSAMAGWIGDVIGKIEDLIAWLDRIHVPKIDLPGGKSAGPQVATAGIGPQATGFARAGLMGSPGTRSASVSPSIVVNVNGALDPDAVARQIERILRSRTRRTSGPRRIGAPVQVGAI